MSDATIQRFEKILTEIRQPARLVGGESGAGPGFSTDRGELRVALGFPDSYEVGISNQAIQVLYHLAHEVPGVGVERTYLPWVDAIAAMRREAVPLLTLETWTPVGATDVFAVTVQHEFNYTNLLEMLDLAVIPLKAEERTEEHPLVLAGGPSCANFLPLARFLDAVAVGDGEEVFPEMLRVLVAAKRTRADRQERKRSLSAIEGVFVPGVSKSVRRRAISRLEEAPYPDECLVPLTAGVHDRAWIEIMRGCTRGCRFCQAGMWYRPVRERSAGQALSMAERQLLSSGHQELAFASLSTTDYSCIEELLTGMAAAQPEVRVSLPSLRVDSAAVRLAELASPTGPSLTLAPEAGSQRMRDIINKNVTEDDVLAAATQAFSGGKTTLKLYFMMGLPLEEDEDVVAIAELCLRLLQLGRRLLGTRAARLQLNVNVNNFVPKAFTPFQWNAMAGPQTLERRQDLLRSRLRKPGIMLTVHSPAKSYLEAALARGDESMGAVIEEAWRRGARFDSWTEQFREDAWRAALDAAGTSAERLATASIPHDQSLPWDIITGAPDREFLWQEWEKAQRGERTGDCRWDGCWDCGACDSTLGNELAVRTAGGQSCAETRQRGVGAQPETAGRFVARFSVTGRDRFIGHLDRVEVWRRAVRKAGGRLAMSAGMRPKPLLSLALPLAVGVEGLEELCGFELAEGPDEDFARRLGACLPAGTRLLRLEAYSATRSVAARVVGASYEVGVSTQGKAAPGRSVEAIGCDRLREGAARFAAAPAILVDQTREGRSRRVDVKTYTQTVSVEAGPGLSCTLSFSIAATPAGSTRPERVVQALAALADVELKIERIARTKIHLA